MANDRFNNQNIVDMKEVYSESPIEYEVMVALVKSALFDDADFVNVAAANALRKRFGGLLKKCVAEEGKIYVTIGNGDKSKLGYLCNIPNEYCGRKIDPKQTYLFDLSQEPN